jgi:hypothetical protein
MGDPMSVRLRPRRASLLPSRSAYALNPLPLARACSCAQINGSAILAMTGKGCVAIAADRRFGIQGQVRRRFLALRGARARGRARAAALSPFAARARVRALALPLCPTRALH